MIDIEDIELLKRNISTLKETSKDNHDGDDFYMTQSSLPVIDFDKVKDEYICDISISEIPKSNDALYIKDEHLVFIEFKNGQVKGKKQFDIRLKIFDSLLIITDIINKGISYTRKNMDYILVYNDDKNFLFEKKENIQDSFSRDEITKRIHGLANKELIRFGLERFQKLYFHEVHTYTIQEFEEKFVGLYSSTDII
ncbi:hypothetical protein AN1V17_30470 [Vallitalea sediminicola]